MMTVCVGTWCVRSGILYLVDMKTLEREVALFGEMIAFVQVLTLIGKALPGA